SLIASEVERTAPPVGDTVHIAVIGTSRRHRPTVIGVRLGEGRIAAFADASMLTNDVLRACNWGAGITAVRTLEWLSDRDGATPRREIVFDEFHHGYGNHASVIRTMAHWASRTPSGRTALQLSIAGLVLLLAAGARAL